MLTIVSTAKIKKCIIKEECADLAFDGLDLSADQYKQIASYIKAGDLLELVIQPIQAELFGDQPEEKPAKKTKKTDAA